MRSMTLCEQPGRLCRMLHVLPVTVKLIVLDVGMCVHIIYQVIFHGLLRVVSHLEATECS